MLYISVITRSATQSLMAVESGGSERGSLHKYTCVFTNPDDPSF